MWVCWWWRRHMTRHRSWCPSCPPEGWLSAAVPAPPSIGLAARPGSATVAAAGPSATSRRCIRRHRCQYCRLLPCRRCAGVGLPRGRQLGSVTMPRWALSRSQANKLQASRFLVPWLHLRQPFALVRRVVGRPTAQWTPHRSTRGPLSNVAARCSPCITAAPQHPHVLLDTSCPQHVAAGAAEGWARLGDKKYQVTVCGVQPRHR